MRAMGSKGKPKLTPKRRAFVEKVASGEAPTLAQAYRDTYSAEGFAPHALHVEASRLAKHPDVALCIEERRRVLDARSGAKVAGGKAYVLRRLREEADDMDSPANARINALSLLAKASGALEDAVDREAKRASASEAELLAELEARLSHLYPDIGAIDVSGDVIDAQDVQPEPAESPVSDEPDEA